jgi:hypothetical protein
MTEPLKLSDEELESGELLLKSDLWPHPSTGTTVVRPLFDGVEAQDNPPTSR